MLEKTFNLVRHVWQALLDQVLCVRSFKNSFQDYYAEEKSNSSSYIAISERERQIILEQNYDCEITEHSARFRFRKNEAPIVIDRIYARFNNPDDLILFNLQRDL